MVAMVRGIDIDSGFGMRGMRFDGKMYLSRILIPLLVSCIPHLRPKGANLHTYMHTYLKNKPAWLQLMIFGALTLAITIASSLIGLSVVAYTNHLHLMDLSALSPEDLAKPEYAGVVKGMLIVQFFGVFLLPSLVFAYLSDPHPLAFAGLKSPDKKSFILFGVIIILFSYLMVEWLGVINQQLVQNLFGKAAREWIEKGESNVGGTLHNILTMKNAGDLLQAILLVGVLAAIGEEIFFRGILQRIFIQIFKNPWVGIIITAAIFSAVHGQFLGFLPRMILGIILGALYWYSGSLWPAITGHFIFNSLQVILVYYGAMSVDQQTTVGDKMLPVVGIGSLILVILLLYYVRKHSVTSYSRVYHTFDGGSDDRFAQ